MTPVGIYVNNKPQVQQALKELEESVLYTPQAARVIPNILYNMSRYQDNDAFLQEALMNLLIHVNDREEKAHIRELVKEYIAGFREPERQMNRSRIMDTLAKIIAKQDRETHEQPERRKDRKNHHKSFIIPM